MIAQTKIHIPYNRKTLVTRPRLNRRLDDGLNAKLTIVSAQAGYGKTTALSEWAKRCGTLAAWVSLDMLDNDWSPFWRCVLAAIRERVPGFGRLVEQLLSQEADASRETVITAFANALAAIDDELVVILDDYHFIDVPDIHHSLGLLLEYMPSHAHFYIASRVELEIPTARLQAKGEILRIGAKDLQFEMDESIEFFRDGMNLPLSDEQARELFRQTEGWVSGLQLAAISLLRGGNIAESIRRFSGRQRDIADYLLEEVYRRQLPSLREFMLETSVLGRMNSDLCRAVTGRTDSQEQLERLERLNLFIIPLDEERNWYRYHHLLSDFLKRLAAAGNPDRWTRIHARAADWLESRGFEEDAVEHYIKGGLAEDAVRVIERILPDLMQSKGHVLLRWIAALPESSYESKPMFEMFYISRMVVNGEWDRALRRAEQAEKRFTALKEFMPTPDWRRLMGNLYYFCGIISYLRQNLPLTSHYFELLDRYLPEGSSFQNMGGKRYQGYDQFMDLLSLVNDLPVVEDFLLRWIKAWETRKDYPFVGYQYVTYCMLLYEWNRLEETELYLGQAMSRDDLRSVIWIRIQLRLTHLRLLQALGKEEEADEWLTRLEANADSPDYELIARRIRAERAYLHLRQGRIEKALEWAESCGLSHSDEVVPSLIEEHLVLVRVIAAAGRTADANQLLEKLRLLAEEDNRLRVRIKLLIVQSTLLWQSGHTQESLVPLRTALRLAEPAGYIRSFVDEGPAMADMLAELQKERGGFSPYSVPLDYVIRLRQAFSGRPSGKQSTHERLTEQEAKVLALIAEGLLNREIADRLTITLDTVKFHVKNVYRKLDAHSRAQALRNARRSGFLS